MNVVLPAVRFSEHIAVRRNDILVVKRIILRFQTLNVVVYEVEEFIAKA